MPTTRLRVSCGRGGVSGRASRRRRAACLGHAVVVVHHGKQYERMHHHAAWGRHFPSCRGRQEGKYTPRAAVADPPAGFAAQTRACPTPRDARWVEALGMRRSLRSEAGPSRRAEGNRRDQPGCGDDATGISAQESPLELRRRPPPLRGETRHACSNADAAVRRPGGGRAARHRVPPVRSLFRHVAGAGPRP